MTGDLRSLLNREHGADIVQISCCFGQLLVLAESRSQPFCLYRHARAVVGGFRVTVVNEKSGRVGAHVAKEIIFSGQMIDAQRALAIGLVNAIHPPDKLMEAAVSMMKTILANGPLAVAYAKYAINQGADLNLPTGLIIERETFAQCFAGPDQREGMKAFLDKRDPKFEGK